MDVEKIFKDFILDSLGKGQNCLLNIGPKPDGSIPEMQKSRLKFMSKFFQKYGAITGGSRANKTSYQRDFDGIYGMLDRVNNKFYSSCTSNNFTYE